MNDVQLGFLYLPYSITCLVMSFILGKILDKFDIYKWFATSIIVMCIYNIILVKLMY